MRGLPSPSGIDSEAPSDPLGGLRGEGMEEGTALTIEGPSSASVSGPVLAVDPGPEWSAWVVWCPDSQQVLAKGYDRNADLRARIYREGHVLADVLVIEQIASYGMAVGAEVFQTCVESGRLAEAWHSSRPVAWLAWLPRLQVKLTLCQSPRARDANIRQALIDRFGPPGTKKAPGRLYGISSHLWAALAVAVTWGEMRRVIA